MEVLKHAILQQEAVFRHQVRELHRLYWTQKNLLIGLPKGGHDDLWQSVGSAQEYFKRLKALDLQIPSDVCLNLNVGSTSIHVSATIQESVHLVSLNGLKEEIGTGPHDVNLFSVKSHPTSRVHIDLNETLVVECSDILDDLSPSSPGDISLIEKSTNDERDKAFKNGFKNSSSFSLKASLEEDLIKLKQSDNDNNNTFGCTNELEELKSQPVSSDSRMQASIMTSRHETEDFNLGSEIKSQSGCTGTVLRSVSEESGSNQVVDSILPDSFVVRQPGSLQVKLEEGFEFLGSEILNAAEMLVQLSLQSPCVPHEPESNPDHSSNAFEFTTLRLQECRLADSLPCEGVKNRVSCDVSLRRGSFRSQKFQKDLHNLRCSVGREKKTSNVEGLLLPMKCRRSRRLATSRPKC